MKIGSNLAGGLSSNFSKSFGNLTVFLLPSIAVVTVIFAFLLINPRIKDILDLNKSIKDLENKVANVDRKLSILSSLDSNSLLSQVTEAEKALPSQKDIPGLLSSLDRLAQETGVSITSFQVVPGEITATSSAKAIGAESLPFKMSVSGSYEGVKSFLSKAVNSNRTLRIRSVAISAKSQAGQSSVSASLDMEAFYQVISRIIFAPSERLPDITVEEQKALEKARLRPNLSEVPGAIAPTGKVNPFQSF